ncbi:TetR family transcriptional regulator [Nocardia sp. R6R-6]|uniref:TetR family transcriptional regulator n=1 Tax=Nocardia sp. R6R-6 TaxID=3459303 RepID=UPI00403D766F
MRAAREVFAEYGYAGAKTRDILARSGITSPTLHHHFGSKAGLYLAVLHEVIEEILHALEDAVDGRSTFLDRVDAILDASVRMNRHDPTLSRLVFAAPVEVRRNPELTSGAERVGGLAAFFENMCRTSDGLAVDPVSATQALMTIIYGLGRSAMTLDQRQYEEVVAAVRALVHGEFAEHA